MNQQSEKKGNIFSFILFIISQFFYLTFAFIDGVDICDDSYSYMTMDVAREPFYPLFLAFFRKIFGDGNIYLFAVILFQGILAGLAAWMITHYLAKRLSLKKWETVIIFIFPFMVSLLCRFGAQRAAMYSNSILTEGITLSLYLIFFRFLLEYFIDQTKLSFTMCFILSVILFSTRKQMIVALFLFLFVLFVTGVRNKRIKSGVLQCLIAVFLVLVLSTGFDYCYNYALRGIWAKHSSDTRFLTTVGFYITDEEDIQSINDPSIRQLTSDIYTICRDNGYIRSSAVGGWSSRVDHFLNNYDRIQINTMWPMVQNYAKNVEGVPESQIAFRTDEILNTMNKALLFKNPMAIVKVFWDNFRYGMVTTIAQKNRILNWYSIVAYIIYTALLIYKFCSVSQNGSSEKTRLCVSIAILVLLAILVNVGLVAAVIFCQPRYTIYNMSMFYTAGFLLLRSK